VWLDSILRALDDTPAPVTFFLRDDDAGWEDDRLRALLDLVAGHGLPIDLAVIPTAAGPRLAHALLERRARGEPIGLHQHGFAHRDHETPPGRRCEFGPSRSRARQRADLAAGAERLRDLLGDAVDPLFTPPWNRCTRVTGECLVELGFTALSRDATAAPLEVPGLAELPVAVDWLRRRRGVALSRAQVADRLADAIVAGGPVGVMLHHAVMDARVAAPETPGIAA
jgi:peptidoglycan/xylan/chitin deacetylase (PgdA/CDA1 family)